MMNTPSTTHVGLLGLGIIGSRVAENLRKAGHTVSVWSRTGRAVPGSMPSPGAVAGSAQVIQIFVRDDAALLEVMKKMLPVLTADHIIMNHATVSKAATMEASRLCESTGAAFLDAPFTGSKLAAQNGKLCYYIGGSTKVLERARPVLEASSAKIVHLGGIGDAMVLKIVTNLVTAVTVKALAEAAAITKGQGVPLEALKTALESNANYSALIGMKLPAIMSGDFEAHFSLVNMLKDADFALALAADSDTKTPALDCTAEAMRAGVDEGMGDLDFSVIGRLSE
jgi:3-hydroxyisobutyrate dehydrogenase-like beta-hydroxyacid dehydrogenase